MLRFGANEILRIIHSAPAFVFNPPSIRPCDIRVRRQPMSNSIDKICLVVSPTELLLRGRNNNTIGRESSNKLAMVCRQLRIARHAPDNNCPTTKAIWKFTNFCGAALHTTDKHQGQENEIRWFRSVRSNRQTKKVEPAAHENQGKK